MVMQSIVCCFLSFADGIYNADSSVSFNTRTFAQYGHNLLDNERFLRWILPLLESDVLTSTVS